MKQEPNYRLATSQPDHIMVSISGDAKSSMSITWRTCADIKDGYVEYYEKGNEKLTQSAITEVFESDINTSHIHFAMLKGLKPGTRYYYTVGSSDIRSDEYYFETEEENLTHFKFVCISDHQKDNDHYNPDYSILNGFLKKVFKENPDIKFIFTAGDNTNNGQHEIQWNAMYDGLKGIIEYRPYMMTLGNHDNRGFKQYFPVEKDRYYAEPAVFFNTQHKYSYPLNGPEGWQTENYAFNYGNCQFLVYSVNEPVLVNEWALDKIKTSDKTWQFGAYHFPIYYAGPNLSNDDGYPMMRESVESLDVMFSGHEHGFSRTFPIKNEEMFDKPSQGTIHYELGNGHRNPPGTKMLSKIWHSAFYAHEEKLCSCAIVEVNGNKITITSMLEDGRIFDECVIDKDKDEILPHAIAPVFGEGRTRMIYKGMDPGLCCYELPCIYENNIWYVPFGTLVSFIGGDTVREKGKMTTTVYGKTAVFTDESDIAVTNNGEVKLDGNVKRFCQNQLYVPLDSACKIFGMKWAYAKHNNFITIESANESHPVPTQP